jgi:hypothetical protein
MTKTQFRLGVLVIFAAILLHNLTSPDRYKIVAPVLLVDGITGKTWKATGGKWQDMQHE